MTKLNRDMRNHIHNKIMKDLPIRNFVKAIYDLIQEEVIKHAPESVQELYADGLTRDFVNSASVDVRQGNKGVNRYWNAGSGYTYYNSIHGLKDSMTIRMDDAENMDKLPEGSLYKAIVTKLADAKLVAGYFEQETLRENVSKRLRSNLESATTIKRLYEVLEPELHGFIPQDTTIATLPSCVAPVVDDLRRLGAILPGTPKVTK